MKRTRGLLRAGCLGMAVLTACLGAVPGAAQQSARTSYALPAQDLGGMLRAIARASGREILFTPEAVAGHRAPALTGIYSFEEALARILEGTGLVAERAGGVTTIRPARAPAAAPERREDMNQAITVTGTRIRGASGASPMIVTTRTQMEDAGVTDLAGFARLLPQNFTGGQNPGVVGAGQGGQANINNSTTLNLRGLGPDATLTLINGHRVAYDAVNQGVDISAIPLAAVERIEVITDGASALYGSDAVAGVANIILRRDFDGAETRVRFGASTGGGNVQQQFSLVTGTRWNGGGFMVAGDFNRSSAIDAADRPYTRGLDDSATILPRQRQLSGIVAAHHRLSGRLILELDAQAVTRRSEKANVFFATSDVLTNGLLNRPRVDSFSVTPSLRAELPFGWEGRATYSHAESRTEIVGRFSLNGSSTTSLLIYDNRLDAFEVTAEGPLIRLPGGTARLALGGGLRTVQLDNLIFDTTGGGARSTRDITERRNVLSAYGELSVPLVGDGNRLALLHSLRLTGAVRYERYEGIDEILTPKLGLIYQPVPDLTLSLNWGRSFKVPTLFQVNQARTGTLLAGSRFAPQPVPALPAGSNVLVLGGGNPDLEAERARNWTASAEWRPAFAAGLRLQASYFDIDYRGRVVAPLTGTLSALGNPQLASLVTLAPPASEVAALVVALPRGLDNQTGAPFDPTTVSAILDGSLRNAARERVRGVDLLGEYGVDIGGDRLLLIAAASYLESERQLVDGQPLIERAGRIFNPPNWRGRIGATWRRANVQLGLFVNHVAGTLDDRLVPSVEIGSFTTLDATALIRTAGSGALAGIEVRLALLNLLDADPQPIRNADPAAPPFDSTNQSAIGRFVGLQLARRW